MKLKNCSHFIKTGKSISRKGRFIDKKGKLSLSVLAGKIEMTVSETIDLVSEFGAESPIDYEDYLKGFGVFKKK